MDITAGHSPLHLRSDHVVVVHHRVRVHELTHGLHFSFGRLGFLGDLLAELQRGEALELGGLVPELCVGLLETLEVPAHRALLVVLGVEVDEDLMNRPTVWRRCTSRVSAVLIEKILFLLWTTCLLSSHHHNKI